MCRTVHGWFGVAPQAEFLKLLFVAWMSDYS